MQQRVVDFDAKEREWLDKIKQKQAFIKQLDEQIAEAQGLKEQAVQEIRKFEAWICYGREITLGEKKPPKTAACANETVRISPGLSMPAAILQLLQAEAGRKFRTAEIREKLRDAGYGKDSELFPTMVRTTLWRLVNRKPRGLINHSREADSSVYWFPERGD